METETHEIRIQESRRSPMLDGAINFATGTLIVSPLADAIFGKLRGTSGFFESLKQSFTTKQGWKTHLISGTVISAVSVAFYALTGSYRKEIKTVPVEFPAGTVLPGETPAPLSDSNRFQEKEAARREQAQEQGSQIA